MAIHRTHNMVALNADIFAENGLSFEAMGILAFALTKPEGWYTDEDVPDSVIDELVESGYMAIHKSDEGYMIYSFSDSKNNESEPPTFDIASTKAPGRKTKPVLPKSGYIYLVRELSESHVKIGKTRNIKDRVRTFSVKLPFKVETIHELLVKDMHDAEKVLHRHFSRSRVGGEWFELTDDDIDLIKTPAFIKSLGIECL